MRTTLYRVVAATAIVLAACRPTANDPAGAPQSPGANALRADVAWLSSDALAGRATGSPGFDSAAAFVTRRYAALGVATAPGMTSHLQHYTVRPTRARNSTAAPIAATNVVGYIRGTDPALANEVVVLGAHLDHLGRSTEGALDPQAGAAIRNGADDNASGSVMVLELARRLSARPTKRSILLLHFSGEELGLLGSAYFVDNSPVPLAQVQAMVNFDMVGRLTNDRLIVYGVGTAAELPKLIDSVSAGTGLVVNKVPDGIGPSDHASFHSRDLPVLHFFTDLHEDYHRATDDVARINAEGMRRVADVAERATRALADRPEKLAVQRTVASVGAPAATRQSSGVYFGSIPDMGAGDVAGMRISGVTAGSPADRAGLKAGDVVVEFGGNPVKDIYEYTDALNSFQPGDAVSVVVVRNGERVTLAVTLGRRGG